MWDKLTLTDVLDLAGLVAVAAGLGFAAGHWIGMAGLAVSGTVVMGGSWLAQRAQRQGGS